MSQVFANNTQSMRGFRVKDQREVLAAAMPAHTDLYYGAFKNHQKLLSGNNQRMQVDQIGFFGQNEDIDNFSLNFSSIAPFWEHDFNKEVKINYRHASLKGITTEISKALMEAVPMQDTH